ncbi:MAG TPA: M50 family metallopeptidase, partial [Candidatus Humimicrobiaceae bacterium]|nr:M50 family metallopeptidase [Candidatus Humimicrobiaceae bacterium]
PFGAFVKLYGEEGGVEDIRSFSEKPIWQRVLIIVGGVVTFWIVAIILLSIVMGLGVSVGVSDEENGSLADPKVQVLAVAPDSPAEIAGIKVGDTLKQFNKAKEVQEFTEEHKGEEVTLTIERGKKVFEVSLVPRIDTPEDEGAMGVALARTVIKSYPWYQAPIKGIEATITLTGTIVITLAESLGGLVTGKGLPPGVQLTGPVGIGSLMIQFAELGINYYLHFIAVISIYLAIFNILPIPALDGGKLIFLGIEAVKKKPVSPKIEQRITTVFFTLLIVLLIWVTINDVARLF